MLRFCEPLTLDWRWVERRTEHFVYLNTLGTVFKIRLFVLSLEPFSLTALITACTHFHNNAIAIIFDEGEREREWKRKRWQFKWFRCLCAYTNALLIHTDSLHYSCVCLLVCACWFLFNANQTLCKLLNTIMNLAGHSNVFRDLHNLTVQ